MKRTVLIAVLFFTTYVLNAQADYRVVFDMTSRDTVNQQSLVRQISLISKGSADAKLEVVVYSQGLDFAVKGKSNQENTIAQLLAGNKNISIKVCEATMKRNNIDRAQLIPGVEVVPDGIYEIVTKQREGWGYIKVAH